VYLEGIFSGSADIKTLLPVETGRFSRFRLFCILHCFLIHFCSISAEFLALMKRVVATPRIMEIVNFQGVLRTLERLADMLAKIQKALGEYLERERASFPRYVQHFYFCAIIDIYRFYFVGDEDLLEIIGNSKNIPRLQKHFKKMFAGVASILLRDEDTVVHGLTSREGEVVRFMFLMFS
jgi:dynein heavy chain 1